MGWMIAGSSPAGAGNFSINHRVRTGSGTHPVSYPMGNMGFSLGIKQLGREADYSPSFSAEVKECVELYFHSSNTPLWCGVSVKKCKGTKLPFTFYTKKLHQIKQLFSVE
jgi:hypothetical protein